MYDLLLTLVIAAAPAPGSLMDDTIPTPAPAECDKQFVAYDANRDGKLTYKEYADGCWRQLRFVTAPTEAEVRGHKAGYTSRAAAADRNKDGKLSPAEHRGLCQTGMP